jgi:hypothetical protein
LHVICPKKSPRGFGTSTIAQIPDRDVMDLMRELFGILLRMLLFAIFAAFGFAGSEYSYRMADEVEHDLPQSERTSSKLFAMRWRFRQILTRHRLMFPASRLRRKIGITYFGAAVTFLVLIFSLPWSTSAR